MLDMDAAQALADLAQVSTQIEAAVILDSSGTVLASSMTEAARSDAVARAARELFTAAEESMGGADAREKLVQGPSLIPDAWRLCCTRRRSSARGRHHARPHCRARVFLDLKTCLRHVAGESLTPKPKARSGSKKAEKQSQRRNVEMARGKVVAGHVIGAAALASGVMWRRRSRKQDHIDLYFADGSLVSLEPGSGGCGAADAARSRRRRGRSFRCVDVDDAELAGLMPGPCLPRGRLLASLGEALHVLPRQVPVGDASGAPGPTRSTGLPPRFSRRSLMARSTPDLSWALWALAAAASLASGSPVF